MTEIKRSLWAVGIFLVTSVCVAAQNTGGAPIAAGSHCAAFVGRLDGLDKLEAAEFMSGLTETSAVRASNRQASVMNINLERQLLLQQMHLVECPIPKFPIARAGDYYDAALKCKSARTVSSPSPPECDSSKWKRFIPSDADPWK